MKIISVESGGDYQMFLGDEIPVVLKVGKRYVLNDPNAAALSESNVFTRKIVVQDFMPHYKKYNGEDLNGKTLVAYRTGGAGDILFMTPAFRYLKEKYPECKIIVCSSKAYGDLITTNPDVDEFYPIPVDLEIFEKAEYHILFERVIEESELAEYENAYDLYLHRIGIAGEFANKYKDRPDTDYILPTIILQEEKVEYVEDIFEEFGFKEDDVVIGFNPWSTTPLRNYPFKNAIGLAMEMIEVGYKVILLGGRGESDLGDRIRNYMPEALKPHIRNFTYHSYDFGYSVAAVAKCDAIVGVDSAVLHMAGGLKKPMVGLFGPFRSKLRIGYYKQAFGIEAQLRCAPCFLHGPYPCRFAPESGESPCLELLTGHYVFERLQELLVEVGIINLIEEEEPGNEEINDKAIDDSTDGDKSVNDSDGANAGSEPS